MIHTGYTTLTPYLVIDGAQKALTFYAAVFSAKVVSRLEGPNGTIAHAELDFGHGRLQLSDPVPSMGLRVPGGNGVSSSLVIYVPDVDAVVARAVEHGATLVEKVSTFVTGDRYGALMDPFGRRWAVMTRVEDVSPEEAERRVKAWMEQQPQ